MFLAGIQAGLTWLVVVGDQLGHLGLLHLRVLVGLPRSRWAARTEAAPGRAPALGLASAWPASDGGHRPGPEALIAAARSAGGSWGRPAGARPPKADFPGHPQAPDPSGGRARRHPGERQGRAGPGRGGTVRGGGHRRPVRPGGGQLPGRGRRQAAAPDLVLIAGHTGDPDEPRLVGAAVAIELTHLSSLYHDDVMDEAELRRGMRSANARYDNKVAALPATTCSPGPRRSPPASAPRRPGPARPIARLTQGQIREVRGPGPDDDPVDHYLEVLADKTGA